MKKRLISMILMTVIAIFGCGQADAKNISNRSDEKTETTVETEMVEENTAFPKVNEGLKEEVMETGVEENASENAPIEQAKSEEIQKQEEQQIEQKTETKQTTETFSVTTPIVNDTVVTTQAVNKETCEHWYQPEYASYEIIEHYTFGCNGCGFQLCTLQECTDSNGEVRIDAVNLLDLYSHSPCETERFDGFCDGGGFHSHWFTSARCAFCYGECIKIACFFSETGKMCIKNEEALGPYERTEEGQNPTAYIKSCDCGQNGIFVGQASEDSVYGGLLFLKETCVHCGDIKTYPQR